jgi:hypothetical protein
MFCERVQHSCPCPPLSHWTSRGALSVGKMVHGSYGNIIIPCDSGDIILLPNILVKWLILLFTFSASWVWICLETGCSDQGLSWFSSLPSDKFWGITLKQGTIAPFHILLSNFSFTNYPTIQCYIVSEGDEVSLNKTRISLLYHPS